MNEQAVLAGALGGFDAEELSIFKRYLEENIVCPTGAEDLIEENLSYYAGRHTDPAYLSPAESLQANAYIAPCDELTRNLALYQRALEWHSTTVHPIDSEYVIKREKYVFVTDVPDHLARLVEYLNSFAMRDFFIADVLVQVDGVTYQYLPQKNFLFRRTGVSIAASDITDLDDVDGWDDFCRQNPGGVCAVLPVFTPIRRMLFMGEAGYRIALQEYGRLEERLRVFLSETVEGLRDVRIFETARMNDALGLDGIERSVLCAFMWPTNRAGGEQ